MKFCYIYDLAFDLISFYCERDFRFKRSVKMDEGIFLDFDDKGRPVALEMIGASKILSVHRKNILEPDFKLHVEITRDLIKTEIKVKYSINQREFEVNVKNEIPNEYLMHAIDVVITN